MILKIFTINVGYKNKDNFGRWTEVAHDLSGRKIEIDIENFPALKNNKVIKIFGVYYRCSRVLDILYLTEWKAPKEIQGRLI